MAIRRVAFLAAVVAFLLVAFPASSGGWRDCHSIGPSLGRMWFFRDTDFAHIVNPAHITRCEYKKFKERTMFGYVLERSIPGDRLGRAFLTPILSGSVSEHGYRVEGRTFSPRGTRPALPSSPYIHEILPQEAEKRSFALLTDVFVGLPGGARRLTIGFYGSRLTDEEIGRALEEILTHLSL